MFHFFYSPVLIFTFVNEEPRDVDTDENRNTSKGIKPNVRLLN